jgi:hypothetical protein
VNVIASFSFFFLFGLCLVAETFFFFRRPSRFFCTKEKKRAEAMVSLGDGIRTPFFVWKENILLEI